MAKLSGFSVPVFHPPSCLIGRVEVAHEQAEDNADNLTGCGSILHKIIYDGNYGHQIFISSFTHAIWLGKRYFWRKGSKLLACLGQHSVNFQVSKGGLIGTAPSSVPENGNLP